MYIFSIKVFIKKGTGGNSWNFGILEGYYKRGTGLDHLQKETIQTGGITRVWKDHTSKK